jgi:hypothetical protein
MPPCCQCRRCCCHRQCCCRRCCRRHSSSGHETTTFRAGGRGPRTDSARPTTSWFAGNAAARPIRDRSGRCCRRARLAQTPTWQIECRSRARRCVPSQPSCRDWAETNRRRATSFCCGRECGKAWSCRGARGSIFADRQRRRLPPRIEIGLIAKGEMRCMGCAGSGLPVLKSLCGRGCARAMVSWLAARVCDGKNDNVGCCTTEEQRGRVVFVRDPLEVD